jgi:hypothetical protein
MTVTHPSMFLAGLEWFAIRNSLQIGYTGGLAGDLLVAAAGRRVGQRGQAIVGTIACELMPPNDAAATTLRNLIRTPGIMPLVLPDGSRYPVLPQDGGNTMAGFYENHTGHFNTAWDVRANVLMADLPWGGAFPGDLAYSRLSTNRYNYAGTIALVANTGWRLTGDGHWNTTYIRETSNAGVVRNQATLYADFTVGAGAQCYVGFSVPGALSGAAGPQGGLPGAGVWIDDVADTVYAMDAGQNTVGNVLSITGNRRWRLYVTVRPSYARLELWDGKVQRMISTVIPWTMRSDPIALLSVYTGQVTLNQWWVML